MRSYTKDNIPTDKDTANEEVEKIINNDFEEIGDLIGDIISAEEQNSINNAGTPSSIEQIKNRSDELADKGDQIIQSTKDYALNEIRTVIEPIFDKK
ncbi:MAG: hypothetical protein H0U78_01895 [Rickettsiaceae bacterium]|jgi:hypothetical protein|nr:hypothetical protein [Rickettsiaceae bacterium]